MPLLHHASITACASLGGVPKAARVHRLTLPHLRSLHLENVSSVLNFVGLPILEELSIVELPGSDLPSLFPHLGPPLKRLAIHLPIHASDELLKILRRTPSLEHLELYSPSIAPQLFSGLTVRASSDQSLPRLETLYIGSADDLQDSLIDMLESRSSLRFSARSFPQQQLDRTRVNLARVFVRFRDWPQLGQLRKRVDRRLRLDGKIEIQMQILGISAPGHYFRSFVTRAGIQDLAWKKLSNDFQRVRGMPSVVKIPGF
ncbi:hypothetical protein HGRIS_002989 [Hohenbuehelia grisea]|uniref:Uncharacterized protein n=1 Tax=Hohenbuehelia grisea TaxID=104357 RepID=A0ABR3JMC3_9AGAR